MFKGEIIRVPVKNDRESADSSFGERPSSYKCEFCDEMWPSDLEITYHKKGHLDEIFDRIKKGEHFCWSCVRKFENQEQLTDHIKTCHLLTSKDEHRIMHQIYICNYCQHVFFNKHLLTLHIALRHHNEKAMKLITCPKCFKSISIRNVWHHFMNHNFCSLQTCRICCTHFPSPEELESHLLTSHSFQLQCGICSIEFKDIEAYENHYKVHAIQANAIDKDAESKLFKKYFIENNEGFSYPHLQLFMDYKLQKGLKICILCNEICTSDEACMQHISSHRDCKPRPQYFKPQEKIRFICSCGEEFAHKILLKQHILRNKGLDLKHNDATKIEYIFVKVV